jgi:hypothetical protein
VFAPLRWLAPIGVAAALVLALVVAGPIHAEWHDSQLTIAFGKLPAAPTPTPVVTPPTLAAQPVDYQRIIDAVRADQQAYLGRELSRLEREVSASRGKEVNRGVAENLVDFQNKLAYLMKNTEDTNRGLQMLVQKVGE